MKNLKEHILEKLKVTKTGPMELSFEQLRKAMLDCKERNKISNRFSVSLNTGEFKKDPLYTKLNRQNPITSILYREDEYDKDNGWLKLILCDPSSKMASYEVVEIADNQDLHKVLSDETIERIFNYLENVNNITEKLKVTKSSVHKMTLKEFAEERKSLNQKENNFKLVSQYDMKDMFINWVEKMLVEDGVIDEIPFGGFMKHILRFDGDILIDNIVDGEVDPPVSTEMYLTWGEAYMRIVTYYIKNNIFTEPGIILEKLKVTKKTLSDVDGLTIEVPYYEFVIWYTGFLNKKPDEITENDFRTSDFVEFVVNSNGVEVFANAKLAYDFYKRYKDEIVTITVEKQRRHADIFLNIIDFGDEVFYAESYEDFREYIQYQQEIGNK